MFLALLVPVLSTYRVMHFLIVAHSAGRVIASL